MDTVKLICLSHGRIDVSNQALLTAGNPHLDKKWVEERIPALAARLKQLEFGYLYSGTLHRIHETAYELRRAGVRLPAAGYRYYLDARSTLHDSKLYPPDAKEDLRDYLGQAQRLLHEAAISLGASVVLVVTSGAILIALRAIAQQLTFSSSDEMRAWAEDGNLPEAGEVWTFEFGGANAIKETVLEELIGA